MKSNEKKALIILVVVAIIIIGVIFFITRPKTENNPVIAEENKVVEEFIQVSDDGTKLNTSTKLSETKTVNGLKIGNIQFTMKNNQSVLLADVENTTGKETKVTIIDITIIDKAGNELVTVSGIIGNLKAGEKTQFNTSMTLDYANAYDFTVKTK